MLKAIGKGRKKLLIGAIGALCMTLTCGAATLQCSAESAALAGDWHVVGAATKGVFTEETKDGVSLARYAETQNVGFADVLYTANGTGVDKAIEFDFVFYAVPTTADRRIELNFPQNATANRIGMMNAYTPDSWWITYDAPSEELRVKMTNQTNTFMKDSVAWHPFKYTLGEKVTFLLEIGETGTEVSLNGTPYVTNTLMKTSNFSTNKLYMNVGVYQGGAMSGNPWDFAFSAPRYKTAALTETTGTFRREAPDDLTVSAREEAIVGVSGGAIGENDYTLKDGKLILKKEYLEKLGGKTELTVQTESGIAVYTVTVANGKYSVNGWEVASDNNVSFYRDGEWARIKENKKSLGGDIDVVFNREGFDISQPIEFKIKLNSVPTGDRWLGLFCCNSLTTNKLDRLKDGSTTLDIDVSGTPTNPWARCAIGKKVFGGTGTGAFISGSEQGSAVDADGSFTVKIEVTAAGTTVTFSGGGKTLEYSVPDMTSSYFKDGKLYFNSRFHNNTSELFDVEFSQVKNGIPVHYVTDGQTTTVKVAEGTEKITLADAPAMKDGKEFGRWKDAEGNLYRAGEEYALMGETTFTAIPDASQATLSLEYERIQFDGTEKTPVCTVKLNDETIDPAHYDVSYSDNTAVGTSKVTVRFKGDYYGTAEKSFEIVKKTESTTGEDVTLTVKDAAYEKMTVLGSDYVYTVTEASGNEIEASSEIAAGVYTVKAVKETATAISTVTYKVTVEKTAVNNTGEDITLNAEEATYAKMTTLGTEYVYTVQDASGKEVTAAAAIAAGVYTVKAVKETAEEIVTVTYRVTVREKEPNDNSSDGDSSLSSDKNSVAETAGCGSVAGGASVLLLAAAGAATVAFKRKRR